MTVSLIARTVALGGYAVALPVAGAPALPAGLLAALLVVVWAVPLVRRQLAGPRTGRGSVAPRVTGRIPVSPASRARSRKSPSGDVNTA